MFFKSTPEFILIDRNNLDENVYIQCFDLKTKKWWDVPKIINKAIASKLDEIDLVQNFEDKILVNSKSRGLLLLNFNEINYLDQRF